MGWVLEDREDVVYIVDEDEDGGVSNEVQAAKGRDRYRQGNAR